MIVTVTMNPAVDKTVFLDKFTYGGMNRVQNIVQDAGGKGINVSKTIHALGGKTIATGFLGGEAGLMIEHALTEAGIEHHFISIDGETRTNTKIVDGSRENQVTELNEPGPSISEGDIESLCQLLLSYAGPETIFVFSGSVPRGVKSSIYGQLTKKMKKKQSLSCVDADGVLLKEAISAKPYIIKPNLHELSRYFGTETDVSQDALVNMGRELLRQGPQNVVISCGQRGALFFSQNEILRSPGIQVHSNTTVGAGDAMVAALTYGLNSGLSFEQCAKLSIAASAGACTTLGTKPPTKELVDMLVDEVEIQRVN